MPFLPVRIRPGVNVEQTPLLLEAGWASSLNIRFFQGLLQQIGFFQRLTNNKPRGVCRGLFPWADTAGNQYIAEGTTEELAVINNGNLYDVTPITDSSDLVTPFTTNATTTVTVTDAADVAIAGNWININTESSVSNLLLQGPYQIQSVGSGDFTITVPIAAGTSTTGGLTALFTTTNTSSDVLVTLNNHGLSSGSVFTVHVSTAVGGITFYGMYVVGTVVDANNFHINGGVAAGSSASGRENSGNVQIQYLLPSGLSSAGGIAGYGQVGYGTGPYGLGEQVSYLPLRQWSFGAWGSFLIASYTNGAIYVWMPSGGFFSNPAAVIAEAPNANTWVLIAISEQQIVALGAEDSLSSTQDPLLIRWCDVADYTDWAASTTNQAGSFRLPRGSRIVSGLQTALQLLIWTDLGLWTMQYIQPPLVYGFNQIADGCGLIAARAFASMGNVVPWMSQKGFFMYAGGGVAPIPCPIWDIIFGNLNTTQVDKITCAPNSSFSEVAWHLPSASGEGENDVIVKVNLIDGSWDYSNGANAQIYVRTAAYDQSVIGPPMGVDLNSILQQSETGVDGDGQAVVSSARTGWFKMQDGLFIMSLERLIPDFITEGTPNLTISVFVVNYPDDTPVQYGPYPVNASSRYIIVRARGRFVAFQVDCTSSATTGSFYRWGEPLALIYPAGSRN